MDDLLRAQLPPVIDQALRVVALDRGGEILFRQQRPHVLAVDEHVALAGLHRVSTVVREGRPELLRVLLVALEIQHRHGRARGHLGERV